MNQFLNELTKYIHSDGKNSIEEILTIIAVSFILQLLISFVYIKTHEGKNYSKSFVETLIIIGVVISLIIIAVGSNLAKAFSLGGALSIIRFRSIMRDPKDIAFIFFAMATGLACGSQLFLPTIVFVVCVCGIIILLYFTGFAENKNVGKILRIQLLENMNYENLFNELLEKYLKEYTLVSIKTINMGTMFELRYSIKEKQGISEKDFIDEIRTRNGNLRVIITLDCQEYEY